MHDTDRAATGTAPPQDAPGGATDFLDGNALAGVLAELFAVDVTTATSRCAHCGSSGHLAALRVYGRAPGLVARCPHCSEVVLRLVRTPQDMWLDMRGCTALAVPMAPA
ncbi:DUF6510 family protein [Actinacidiphila guanduensis]|uniref:Uncharacterized protein n=1 Tax=Actinacidiphila guanduensis TaxID=310781 RepID=A0A1H0N029_9ACTN|nr:DUF6510 family protein [Actinacidiphila guanduensis]SDO85993.1 hypothetical protein SAMN05216259_113164 [Actinacidiphila guanduensis]